MVVGGHDWRRSRNFPLRGVAADLGFSECFSGGNAAVAKNSATVKPMAAIVAIVVARVLGVGRFAR